LGGGGGKARWKPTPGHWVILSQKKKDEGTNKQLTAVSTLGQKAEVKAARGARQLKKKETNPGKRGVHEKVKPEGRGEKRKWITVSAGREEQRLSSYPKNAREKKNATAGSVTPLGPGGGAKVRQRGL